ncbi:PQQ-dependent dehydrogenase, methanol/ethanol family [Sphingopyxis granuli]|uniref:PQQ-dependent dehydrogenase, methanol/ethanol family n=1 Tax=Sphingopyxis granuli TaxID=267128 RepID=UPI0030B913AA
MKSSVAKFALLMGIVSSALAVSGCGKIGLGKGSADRQLEDAANNPDDWVTHGGTYAEQRFSPLSDINTDNIGQLKLAWYYDLDTNRGQESTPLEVGGILYASTAWSKVKAVDAATGKELWTFDPKVPGEWGQRGCCDVVNRGVAYYDGRIYLGTLDGRLIAIDAKNGQQVWSVQTTDRKYPYTITGAPRVVHGKVIIGNGGAELGVRGYVTAYDARDGKKVWRFYTVPGDPAKGPDGEVSDKVLKEKANATWFGKWYKYGGGGTAWDAIVYDQDLNQLYIGVGNGSPWNREIRSEGKGDNLFLSSIVALDPDTGEYKWHYQETPGDTWDFTASQPIMLTTLKVNGQDRKVLLHAPKNGFFYVIDRKTGKLVSAKNFVPTNWASSIDLATGRPVENPDARYKNKPFLVNPSANGAHNWQPMAYSPKTGLVYIPAQEIPAFYENEKGFKFRPNTWNLGANSTKNYLPEDPALIKAIRASLKGELIAWDPVAQREVWRHQYDGPWNGGVLATGGGLVFQGSLKGTLSAFDAKTGRGLWQFPAQTGVMAAPITYRVNGQQYVAVVVGTGGGYGISSPFQDNPGAKPNGRILAFRIGGTAKLPAWTPPPLAPANPPREKFTPQNVAQGKAIYETNCTYCHGAGGRSGGMLPDLRRSAVLPNKQAWDAVVMGGALKDQGMISFSPWYSPAEIEAVRAYIADRATRLAEEEKTAK